MIACDADKYPAGASMRTQIGIRLEGGSHAMRATWKAQLVAAIVAALCACTASNAQDASARRMALLADNVTVEALAAALEDDDVLVARTAARVLPSKGAAALPALGEALRHDDMLVRRSAAMNLGALGADALELVDRALRDDHELVRQGAVFALMELPHTQEAGELLARAGEDESALVQRTALQASRAAYRTAEAIRLPREGWRLAPDPDEVGREQEWFAADFDDSGWDEIAIEQFWGDAGPNYTGVAWYRLTFELPEREEATKVQMDFRAVDESAWIWLNGEFAGEHDLGPDGWAKPFRIDVTGKLRWGQENQITVRVLNTAMAGGIWKPVSVILLEPAQ